MTLMEFLLARIAEDEAAAFGTSTAGYRTEPISVGIGTTVGGARLRAECEAKRRIIDEHQVTRRDPRYDYVGDPPCITCGQMRPRRYPCATLRALALPYGDHPDCNPAWLAR